AAPERGAAVVAGGVVDLRAELRRLVQPGPDLARAVRLRLLGLVRSHPPALFHSPQYPAPARARRVFAARRHLFAVARPIDGPAAAPAFRRRRRGGRPPDARAVAGVLRLRTLRRATRGARLSGVAGAARFSDRDRGAALHRGVVNLLGVLGEREVQAPAVERSAATTDTRLEQVCRVILALSTLWFTAAAVWEIAGPFGAGHVAASASIGIAGENMFRWGILAPVLDYTLEPPSPRDYYCHHPWGIFWTTAVLTKLFGHWDWVCRLPPVLFSAATPPLLYAIAR